MNRIDFPVSISKRANLFMFVSQLSQWNDFITFPAQKREWIKKTGAITKEDKKELRIFSDLLREAPILLNPIFYFEERTSTKRIKSIGAAKTKKLSKILDHFLPRFEKLWLIEESRLKKIETNLNFRINNNTKSINNLLDLLGVKNLKKKIPVKLFISSKEYSAGFFWPENWAISIECSGIKSEKEIFEEILMHELIHGILRMNQFKIAENLYSYIKNQSVVLKKELKTIGNKIKISPNKILEEAFVSSLIPEGYLRYYLFGTKSGSKSISKESKFRNFIAKETRNHLKKIIFEKEPINQNYFNIVSRAINKFIKTP